MPQHHQDARDLAERAGTYRRRGKLVKFIIAIVVSLIMGLAGGVTGTLEVSDTLNVGNCADDD